MPGKDAAEEDVFSASYLGKETRKSALLTKLNDLHKVLKDLSQDPADRPEGLQRTAAQLISSKILGNPDKDLRLMASCCIVDVFRLFAPDSPYSDEENVSVFEVIISQLRGLSMHDPGKGIGNKIMYILTSLATVKTCVVPVILAQSGIAGADDLVKSLFDALVSSVRPEHGDDVISCMSSVLQACIEESEDVDQELLDVLLSPLLPAAKAENPAAYTLVSGALRRVTGSIQGNISNFINQVLVGAPHSGEKASSELSDSIYPLIYELHKISPELLLRVLPNVCEQLKAEEEEIRIRAVKLLGRLFASTTAEYGSEFARNFREFLGRFVDMSAVVRLEMVDQCALVMRRKASLRGPVEAELVKRLHDSDVEVRQSALVKLLEVGLDDPLLLSVDTFVAIALRAKDRKEAIHQRAVRGLAQIYGKFISSSLPALSTFVEDESGQGPKSAVRRELLDRLSLVPGIVVQYWGYPDPKLKHLTCHLLQETLLPKAQQPKTKSSVAVVGGGAGAGAEGRKAATGKGTPEDNDGSVSSIDGSRASALVLMFSLLDEEQRGVLGTILAYKARVASELRLFLDARKALLAAGAKPTQEEQASFKLSVVRMYKAVTVDKKVQPLEKLHAMKDKTVVKLLTRAVSTTDSISTGLESREELKQRLDSKSQASEYMSIVFDFSAFFVCNQRMLSEVLDFTTASQGLEPAQALASAQLVSLLAKHATGIFSSSATALEEWVTGLAETCDVSGGASKGGGGSSSGSGSVPRLCLTQALKAIEFASTGVAEDEVAAAGLSLALLKLAQELNDPTICESIARASTLLTLQTASSTSEKNSQETVGAAHKRAEAAVGSAVSGLVKGLGLPSSTAGSKKLQRDLLVLGALLRLPSRLGGHKQACATTIVRAARKARDPLLSFLRDKLFTVEHIEKGSSSGSGDKDGGGEAGRQRTHANVLVAGLKAWVALLSTEELLHEDANADSQDGVELGATQDDVAIPGVSEDMNELISVLFDCFDRQGSHFRGAKVASSSTAAALSSAAAQEAMGLISIRTIGDRLSVANWKKLAWALLHGEGEARENLAQVLNDMLHVHPVHMRFLTYPCLLLLSSSGSGGGEGRSSELDQKLSAKAQRTLMFTFQRLRRTQEVLAQRALAADDGDEGDAEAEKALRRAQGSMPEMVLPYLLYLLSYHPEFPQAVDLPSDQDQRRTKGIIAILRTFFKVLSDSLHSEESNLSFLIKQINIISFHDDKHDSSNLGLDFVTVLASKLLNELVKSDEHVVEYHGEITLPVDMFTHKPGKAAGRQGNKRGGMGLGGGVSGSASDNVEHAAMDKVLAQAKAGKDHAKRGGHGANAGRKRGAGTGAGAAEGGKKQKTNAAAKASRQAIDSSSSSSDGKPQHEFVADRPRRAATQAVVSYKDPDENDRETSAWDEAGGQKPRLSSSAMEAGDDDDDDDDEEEDEEEEEEEQEQEMAPSKKRASKPLASSNIANTASLASEDSQTSSSAPPAKTKNTQQNGLKNQPAAAVAKAKAPVSKAAPPSKAKAAKLGPGQKKLTDFVKKPVR